LKPFVIAPASCCPHTHNEHAIITKIIKNNLFFKSAAYLLFLFLDYLAYNISNTIN